MRSRTSAAMKEAGTNRLTPPVTHVVLIVDDYQDCRDMYAAYLTLAGFSVIKARDGFEALELARRTLPDVILMDLGLPGIDGCETTRLLKADSSTRQVPVVALTAQAIPGSGVLEEAGFDSVILKPCLPDELADLVRQVIHNSMDPLEAMAGTRTS